MATIYERIVELCRQKGITPGRMCNDLGYSRNTITALKTGRSTTFKLEKAQRVAAYFGITVDELLGAGDKKAAVPENGRAVDDDDIKFALFGGSGEITDAMFEEVKRFAQMVKLREEAERKEKE